MSAFMRRPRREQSPTKPASPPDSSTHCNPHAFSRVPEAKGVPPASPQRYGASPQLPENLPGWASMTRRHLRDLRRAAGLTPRKEKSWKGAPVFIAGALHCKTQHKACKWRLFPLLVSYLASSCQGKVCGEQSRSREGTKLIRFFFVCLFVFYMADAGFPRTPPAPHKLFFFFFFRVTLEKQSLDAKRCPWWNVERAQAGCLWLLLFIRLSSIWHLGLAGLKFPSSKIWADSAAANLGRRLEMMLEGGEARNAHIPNDRARCWTV